MLARNLFKSATNRSTACTTRLLVATAKNSAVVASFSQSSLSSASSPSFRTSRSARTPTVQEQQNNKKIRLPMSSCTIQARYAHDNQRFLGRVNTIVNMLPQGQKYIIQRFGKFKEIADPGFKIVLPFIEEIAYAIDDRELCIRVDPLTAISQDNIQVHLGGNVFLRVTDFYKAAYGNEVPLYSVIQHAQSAMRTSVGHLELDELFRDRETLNIKVKHAIDDAAREWGIEIKRFELTQLETDKEVTVFLNKQACAEREKRERIKAAEAEKSAIELEADAYKYKLTIQAEGKAKEIVTEAEARKRRTLLEAEAAKEKIIMEAEARKRSIILEAEAEAENIIAIAKALAANDQAVMALNKRLAEKYFETLATLAKKNNTMIVPTDLSNTSSVIAAATSALGFTHQNQVKPTQEEKEEDIGIRDDTAAMAGGDDPVAATGVAITNNNNKKPAHLAAASSAATAAVRKASVNSAA